MAFYLPSPDLPAPAPLVREVENYRASNTAKGATFVDIKQHWAQQCIVQLGERSLVRGYPDGRFRPEDPLTRAELAVVMLNSFPKVQATRNPSSFSDVPSNYWAYAAIRQASAKGFLVGYPDGRFQPNRVVSRVQAIAAIASAVPNLPNVPAGNLERVFNDAGEIPNWVKPAIARATAGFLVVNYPRVEQIQPNRAITRGEVAALLCRALAIDAVSPEYIAGFPRRATQARPIFDRSPEILQSYFGSPLRESIDGERRTQYYLAAGIWQLFPDWTRGGEFAVTFTNNRSTAISLNPNANPELPSGTFAYDSKKIFQYIFGYSPKMASNYPGWYGGGHEGFYINKLCLGDGVVTSYMSSLLGDTDISLSYDPVCQ
jgi:S-layer homology domain